jgi:hypothetical protein
MYYGYCVNCLYLAMGDNQDQGQWSLHLSYLMLFVEDGYLLALYLN